MTDFAPTQGKVAGVALVLSILTYPIAIALAAAGGNYAGFAASLSGFEAIGDRVSAAAATLEANNLATILQVVGFGILAAKLSEKGEPGLATASFGLLLLALTFLTLRITFDAEVTSWAARLSARGESVPETYEALSSWAGSAFHLFYLAYLVAGIGFGWGLLRAGFLAPWVGRVSLGWGILWLTAYVIPVGIPAFPLLFPILFGFGLLTDQGS